MADPVLHIKDSYYFEVPKFLWRYDYSDFSQVPKSLGFLTSEAESHHLSIQDFNRELSGKVVIPQPFATLKNLHEKDTGFAISKFMILELVAAAIVAWMFIRLAQRMSAGHEPRGRWWNFLEVMLLFIRDLVVRPAIGDHDEHHASANEANYDPSEVNPDDVENSLTPVHAGPDHGQSSQHDHDTNHGSGFRHHPADRYLPLFWSMFFFILTCNLLGMLPWVGAPTGAFGVTFGMACFTFATSLVAGMFTFGLIGFWINQVPAMDLPWYLLWVKVVLFPIEILGLVIKHTVLSVRLLANMLAGHLVLLGIMSLILAAVESSLAWWATIASISVLSSAIFSVMELFVAFLQAYIFTFLSALFIGAATHRH